MGSRTRRPPAQGAPPAAAGPEQAPEQAPSNSRLVEQMTTSLFGNDTPLLDSLLDVVDERVIDPAMNLYYGAQHALNPSFTNPMTATGSREEKTDGFLGLGNHDAHEQQYSAHGIPLTEEAWALQNAVDEGKLQDVHNREMLGHFVSTGALNADELGQLDELPADRIAALVQGARGDQSAEALFASLDPEVASSLQTNMLETYMAQANEAENAAFVLEMMPTDTSMGLSTTRGEDHLPNEFRVNEETGLIRHSSGAIADQLRQDPGTSNVFGLAVPYANTPSNVLGRDGTPTDGADHLHQTLRHLDQDVHSVATGYSQGGAAVLDYVDRYGDVDGLDAAVSLAPMGGSDRGNLGTDGLFHGMLNDVPTLSATHALDPARNVFQDQSQNPALDRDQDGEITEMERDSDLMMRGMRFGNDANGDLHSGHDPAAPEAGTYGYPTQEVAPLLGSLLSGDLSGHRYSRQGDWSHDTRD